MDLCFLMKRHSVRKKKKYHLVLKNRRCCLLFRLDKAWLVQKVEKMNTRSVFIFHREREVYFPQQQHPLLHFGWSQGRVGGGGTNGKDRQEKNSSFSGFETDTGNLWGTSSSGRKISTHTAPHRSAQRAHSVACVMENNTASQQPALVLEKRGGIEEELQSMWGRWMTLKAAVCWQKFYHSHSTYPYQESQTISLHREDWQYHSSPCRIWVLPLLNFAMMLVTILANASSSSVS